MHVADNRGRPGADYRNLMIAKKYCGMCHSSQWHLTMPAYTDEWKASEGPHNFSSAPPNAPLSVYESSSRENTLAVVETSHPVVDGNDLVYHHKLISGTMPKIRGATAVFIWIGAGGVAWAFTVRGGRCPRGWRSTIRNQDRRPFLFRAQPASPGQRYSHGDFDSSRPNP